MVPTIEILIFCGGDIGCVRNHHDGGDDLDFFLHRDDLVCGRLHNLNLGDETFHGRVADLIFQCSVKKKIGIVRRMLR